jgi:hypothetical protein
MASRTTGYAFPSTYSMHNTKPRYSSSDRLTRVESNGLGPGSIPSLPKYPDLNTSPLQNWPTLDSVSMSSAKDLTPSNSDSNWSYSNPRYSNISTQDSRSQQIPICPILTGLTSDCAPQICGPDPPCSNFALPELEDCTEVPCLTPPMPREPSVRLYRPEHVEIMAPTSTMEDPVNQMESTKTNTLNDEPDSKTRAARRSKQAHSLVERKYRENINSKIAQLNRELQRAHAASEGGGAKSNHDKNTSQELSNQARKGGVLADAISYINQTEVEMRHMADEIKFLKKRVADLEKLVKCEDCSILKQLASLKFHTAT